MGEILVGATRGVPQQDGQNCVLAFRRRLQEDIHKDKDIIRVRVAGITRTGGYHEGISRMSGLRKQHDLNCQLQLLFGQRLACKHGVVGVLGVLGVQQELKENVFMGRYACEVGRRMSVNKRLKVHFCTWA